MDGKENIINSTIELIQKNGADISDITVREICKNAGVGLGLINYHFGSKDKLIEICVERMVNGIVGAFGEIKEKTAGMTPFERIYFLGNMTLDFLFDHYAVSKISMLTDFSTPKTDDNTSRTYMVYFSLISAYHPEWDETTLKMRTFYLISVMQHCFIRHEEIKRLMGTDLLDKEQRHSFHRKILIDILGGED